MEWVGRKDLFRRQHDAGKGKTKDPGRYGQQARREMLVDITEGDENIEDYRREPRIEPGRVPVSGEKKKQAAS